MSLKQILHIIWVRRLLFSLGFIVPLGIATLVHFFWPRSYTAAAHVVLDVKGTDPTNLVGAPAPVIPTLIVATQTDIIQSQRVALRVVDMLKLPESPVARKQYDRSDHGEADIRHWLADSLGHQLKVEPSRDSSILKISYTASDPNFAASITNAFVDAYLQTNLELKVDPARQTAQWFDDQIKLLRDNVAKAQERLSKYQKETGITVSDERLDVENAKLNELSAQVVQAQSQAYDAQAKRAQAAAATSSGGRGSSEIPEIVANPLIQSLKGELSRQRSHLHELGERLGANHPRYLEAEASVASVQSQIDSEIRNVTRSLGNTAESAQAREKQLLAAVAEQKAKVLQLKQAHDQVTLLQREVDNAQRVFDNSTLRYDQSRLESRLNSTNVNILTPATPPQSHSSPKSLLVFLVAIVISPFLATMLALTGEMWNRRVRSIYDLSEGLGVPHVWELDRISRQLWHPKTWLSGLKGLFSRLRSRRFDFGRRDPVVG